MPQPVRAFVDGAGDAWLALDNGHRIRLPIKGSSGSDGGSGGSGGGSGVTEVFVQTAAPDLGSSALLWVDSDGTASGGGGGGDEVWVAPDPPEAGSGYELWVDTEADASDDYVLMEAPTAICALYSDWQHYVTELRATRVGGLVNLTGFIRWTGSNYAVTAGMQLNFGVVPDGFRPVGEVANGSCLFALGGSNVMDECRLMVDTAGVVGLWSKLAGSMVTNGGWTIVNITYPSPA